jgi:hypothetical protein
MLDEYKNLEAFINAMGGSFTRGDAQSALPKLVSALLGDEVTATGGEITAICELVLQVSINGIAEMDAETRKMLLPDREVRRQNLRL